MLFSLCRLWWFVPAAVICAFLAAAAPGLFLRPLWYDELATRWIAAAPDAGAFWTRLRAGTEPGPPLSMALHFLAVRLLGDHPWALRLPALAGFGLALAGVYRFTGRRLTPVWGGVAACCLLTTGSVYYAQEARAYGLVMGMAAGAMAAWQRYVAGAGRRYAVYCGVFLGVAVCLHYYAILLAVPFAAAEIVRFGERRRLDPPLLAALAAPAVALAAHLPLILPFLSRAEFSSGAWSQAVWSFPSQFWYTALSPAIPALLLAAWWVFWRRPAVAESAPPRFSMPEAALLTGFLLLPVAGLLLGKAVTHVAVARYVYPAALGFAAIAAALLARLAPGGGEVLLLLLAGMAGATGCVEARWQWRQPAPGLLAVPAVAGGDALPLVIDDYLRFAQLSYYGDAGLRGRLYYLTDPEMLPRFSRAGQMETITGLAVQAGSLGGHTAEVRAFLRDHPRFLLFEPLRPEPQESWLAQALAARGVPLTLAGTGSGGRWYLSETGASGRRP